MNNKRGILFALLTALMLAVMVPSIMPGKNNAASVEAKKARISKSRITLRKGGTFKLFVRHKKKKIRWHTSNAKIATVSRGKVTAKGIGKCTVWARHGKRRLTCAVTVRDFNFSVSSKSLKLNKNESQTIVVYSERGSAITCDYERKTNEPVYPTIATVFDATGPGKKIALKITAGNSSGQTTFIITEKKTNKKIRVKVTVIGKNYFCFLDGNNNSDKDDLYLDIKQGESKFVRIRCDDIKGFDPKAEGDILCTFGKWSGVFGEKTGTILPVTIVGKDEGEGLITFTEKNSGKEIRIHVTVSPADVDSDDNAEEG